MARAASYLAAAGFGRPVLAVLLLLGACTQSTPPTPLATRTPTPTATSSPTPTSTPSSITTVTSAPSEESSPTPTLPPSSSPKAIDEAQAWISTPEKPIGPGRTLEVTIVVDPGAHGISGGEATVSFDPEVFEAVDFQVGSLLGARPVVGFRQIDNTAGTVKVAVARTGDTAVPSPKGNFLVVRLLVSQSVLQTEHEIGLQLALADHKFEALFVVTAGGNVMVGP